MRYVQLEDGWLDKQIATTRAEVAAWPEWLRRDCALTTPEADVVEGIASVIVHDVNAIADHVRHSDEHTV